MENAVKTPQGRIMIYHFTDLAPWLKWFRFSTGITTLRLKVVEPYNLQSLVITCGAYLGPDDYDTLSKCFDTLYKQILELNKVNLQAVGKEVYVIKRCTSDGKQRRIDSGNSSAKSSYPIAPEQVSQLGNMCIVCNVPCGWLKTLFS